MLDIFELYNKMKEEEIVLSFKGAMTEDLLSAVFQLMEKNTENGNIDVKRIKKINNILVECLQNLYHHGEDFSGVKDQENAGSVMFLICKNNNRFRIVTGNHMPSGNVPLLKDKIEKVNSLTTEELKNYYRETLSSKEFSEKGGAGLGLIDLARKSGNKIDYRFDVVNESFSFFSLIVNLD